MTSSGWTAVIPVKAADRAKRRLALPPARRAAHAHAFAVDTVTAVISCAVVSRTVVVTDDAGLGRHLSVVGAEVVVASLALNPAVAEGAKRADGPVAALPGDLPALTPEVLEEALAAAAQHSRSVTGDRQRRGSVLLTAETPDLLQPAFGPSSFTAHQAAGFVALEPDAWPGLRQDVDTVEDLNAAFRLGVGRATAALRQT